MRKDRARTIGVAFLFLAAVWLCVLVAGRRNPSRNSSAQSRGRAVRGALAVLGIVFALSFARRGAVKGRTALTSGVANPIGALPSAANASVPHARQLRLRFSRRYALLGLILVAGALYAGDSALSFTSSSAELRSVQAPATPEPTASPTPLAVTPEAAPTPNVTPEPTPEPTPSPPPPTPAPTAEPAPAPVVAAAPPVPPGPPPGEPCGGGGGPAYLAWVWRFQTDGSPDQIRSVLASRGGGIILKTHDGTDWMSTYDSSPDAVGGPAKVASLAGYFEEQGVPFHAWAVVKGKDPPQEAAMAAQVLDAGARSIFLDLEPWSGFWEGTPDSALAFGQELRRLKPDANIVTVVDPRPWLLDEVPVAQFASFSNALAPMLYWDSFNSPANVEGYAESGWPPPGGVISPEFLLDVTASVLQPYGLPILPVGQGASSPEVVKRFADHAGAMGAPGLSLWRYGVTGADVWPVLGPRPPAGQTYVVQRGDTLGWIAQMWSVAATQISRANGLTNPNLIYPGQVLCIPQG